MRIDEAYRRGRDWTGVLLSSASRMRAGHETVSTPSHNKTCADKLVKLLVQALRILTLLLSPRGPLTPTRNKLVQWRRTLRAQAMHLASGPASITYARPGQQLRAGAIREASS